MPLVLFDAVGHALMQEPFEAYKEVEVQRVQVVDELTQDTQLESQAETEVQLKNGRLGRDIYFDMSHSHLRFQQAGRIP